MSGLTFDLIYDRHLTCLTRLSGPVEIQKVSGPRRQSESLPDYTTVTSPVHFTRNMNMAGRDELVPLPFIVVEASSEEAGCEASSLCNWNEDGIGWQSKKTTKYESQTLVLKIQHQEEKQIVQAIEILCHGK